MLPAKRNKVDLSVRSHPAPLLRTQSEAQQQQLSLTARILQKLTEEEQKLFRLYGKLPTHKNVLTKMQKVGHPQFRARPYLTSHPSARAGTEVL